MYIGFLYYFYMDEKLISKQNKPFPFPYRGVLSVLSNTINFIGAFVIIRILYPMKLQNPISFLTVSIPMYLSIFFNGKAKNYMDYATLNVFKSAKPVAVMIVSILIFKKHVPKQRILSVIFLCIGLIIFGYKKSSSSQESSLLGYLTIFSALVAEGIYSPLIDRFNRNSGNPYYTMFFVQLWCSLFGTIVNLKQFIPAYQCIVEHPEFIKQIVLFVSAGLVAQISLFTVVGLSDGLVLSIATTSRKFVTILVSSIIFHNTFTGIQWIGIVIIFSALSYDILSKKSVKKNNEAVNKNNIKNDKNDKKKKDNVKNNDETVKNEKIKNNKKGNKKKKNIKDN